MAAPAINEGPIPFVLGTPIVAHPHLGAAGSDQEYVVSWFNRKIATAGVIALRRVVRHRDPAYTIIFTQREFPSDKLRWKWQREQLEHLLTHTEPIARREKKKASKRKAAALVSTLAKRVRAAAKRAARGDDEPGSSHSRDGSSSSDDSLYEGTPPERD